MTILNFFKEGRTVGNWLIEAVIYWFLITIQTIIAYSILNFARKLEIFSLNSGIIMNMRSFLLNKVKRLLRIPSDLTFLACWCRQQRFLGITPSPCIRVFESRIFVQPSHIRCSHYQTCHPRKYWKPVDFG